MGYGHLHRLDLLVFGRDGAEFVAHLVAFHRHVLALNAGGEAQETEIQKLETIKLRKSSAILFMQTFAAETFHKQQVKALSVVLLEGEKNYCSDATDRRTKEMALFSSQ